MRSCSSYFGYHANNTSLYKNIPLQMTYKQARRRISLDRHEGICSDYVKLDSRNGRVDADWS